MKSPLLKATATTGAVLLFASCATGTTNQLDPETGDDRPDRLEPIELEKDGTVIVGTKFYQDSRTYSRTDEFKSDGRRCGSDEAPLIVTAAPSDCSFDSTSIEPEYQPGVTFEIPIVFHIIVDSDGTGFIPVEMINSQVDILNEDFLAIEGTNGFGGTNTTVRFVLASEDPDGNPTSGINYIEDNPEYFNDPGGSPNQMKLDLAWDTTKFFNVYTNDSAGFLGYATFPQEQAGGPEDGVVVAWNAVGRDSPFEPFDQGRTLTHEIGHYLGLFHTFQGGCGSANDFQNGDLVSDTISHPSPNFGCESGATSCSAGGQLPAANYMNYSDDLCMNQFTAEQTNRLRCTMINYRQGLYRVVDEGANQLPLAAFESVVTDLTVDFTNTSTDSDGDIVSYAWDFGDGATSSDANPSHTYAEAGTYSVTLVVTDDEDGTGSTMADVTAGDVDPGGDEEVELDNGVGIADIAALRDNAKRFFIDVPEGVSNLSFIISGEDGDADLYVREGAPPTLTEFDHRPFLNGSNELVDIEGAAAGRYHVMVHAFTDFTGVTLTASYIMDNGGGELVINEILADPGEYDSNGDGTVSARDDEFLELLNVGSAALDLSGATISDRVGVRATIPAGITIAPGAALVVVSAGSIAGINSVSGGALYLNNKGDDITIRSAGGDVLAMAAYGRSGGKNQSLVRSEEGANSPFVLHTTVSAQVASPGATVAGEEY